MKTWTAMILDSFCLLLCALLAWAGSSSWGVGGDAAGPLAVLWWVLMAAGFYAIYVFNDVMHEQLS